MWPQEIDAFLASELTCVLTTLEKDGSPISVPMWFVWLDGRMYLRAMRHTRKVSNLMRDTRLCCVVESGRAFAELRSVVLKGRAQLVEKGEPEYERVQEALRGKYHGLRSETARFTSRVQAFYDGPRIVIKVLPEKAISWDNAKIRKAQPAPTGS